MTNALYLVLTAYCTSKVSSDNSATASTNVDAPSVDEANKAAHTTTTTVVTEVCQVSG
jgi:hypothetical protein